MTTFMFILVIQINGGTPAMIAAYDQQGDCVEIAHTLEEAMPNGVAWCETDSEYQ